MTTSEPDVKPTDRYGMVATAKILGISRMTLWKRINDGSIKYGNRRYGRCEKFIEGKEILRFYRAQL